MGVRKAFLKDVSFIAISKYSGIIVSIIISMVLARLLSPEDFGVIAIATVFIVFFSLFTDMGIGPAVIQRRDLSEEDLADIFGWTAWIGLVLAGLFFLAAIPISKFYDQETLVSVCRLLSLQLFFSSLNIVPNALLSKDKKFNIIAVRNLAIQIFCGILAIISAFLGAGLYALLISPILSALLLFGVNEYFMKQKIHLLPSWQPLKKIFAFSGFQFLSNVVNYFGNNISSLIIGKTISVSDLGYYQKSQQAIGVPSSAINGVVSPVLFPYLSDMQNDLPKMYSVYRRINKILLTISFPVSVLLAICAKEIIFIMYGPQWGQAVDCFAIMSFTVAMQISSVSIGAVFQACNHTDYLFKIGFINTIISIVCLLIGAVVFKSIEAVAWLGTLSSTWACFFSLAMGYKKCFNESFLPFFIYSLRPVGYFAITVTLGIAFNSIFCGGIFLALLIKMLFWIGTLFVYLNFFTEYDPIYYGCIALNKIKSYL